MSAETNWGPEGTLPSGSEAVAGGSSRHGGTGHRAGQGVVFGRGAICGTGRVRSWVRSRLLSGPREML